MKKGSLKQAFFNSAPVGFFMRHSAWLSSWPFALGYAAMISKGGLHPDLDTAAGFLMIGSAACFSLQKKWPNSFRLSAILGASAALCLSAKGIDFSTMEIVNKWRFVAPLTGPVIANTLIGFQKEIAAFSQNHNDSKNKLVRTFAKAVRYPLLTAACIDLTNGINFVMAAITEKDWMFLGAIGAFALGEFGLIASDPRLQDKYKAFKKETPETGPS
jgi:hypothetical protein